MPLGIVGVVLTGSAELSLHLWLHRIFAFVGLLSLSLFEITVYAMIWTSATMFARLSRLGYLIFQLLAFVNAAFAEWIYPARICITISTWAEYIYIGLLSVFLASFSTELKNCDLKVFCIDDDDGAE
jgi:hypothetical protein